LALHQLDLLFAQQTAPAETAAIIIEPVLGEGGYVPAPASFLSALRVICDKHGINLIFDEVQSGFGRCGRYFACEWSGVKPDIMVFAKGLANGFPLSGVVSSKGRLDMMPPGTMGGTYAGNAVSCAAAIACAEVMEVSRVLAFGLLATPALINGLLPGGACPPQCDGEVGRIAYPPTGYTKGP
jgi:4-aminobutyrate aminotransferase